MKKSFKSALGVTLLEIMLVLAIAAMIIVMSIRYYQSASTNQKVASTMDNITGVMAAGESFLAATGNLSAVSATDLTPYLPGGALPNSPWGGPFTVKAIGANSYSMTIPSVPANACNMLKALVGQNSKLTPDCSTAGQLTVTVTE